MTVPPKSPQTPGRDRQKTVTQNNLNNTMNHVNDHGENEHKQKDVEMGNEDQDGWHQFNIYFSFHQAGHFPTNRRNSPTWGNFTLCRRKYILPRREKMSMFTSVFTVAEKSHFDNSSTFKTNQLLDLCMLVSTPEMAAISAHFIATIFNTNICDGVHHFGSKF